MNTSAEPRSTQRIESLDLLRGFALLGIFVMNIQAMAMIGAAYSNPTAYGDLTGTNYWAWWIGHVFFDQKMMSLFSLLFGAGIALMTESAFRKTGRSAVLHYRRMFWLLIFGLAHAYLIWAGDILVSYAICGMLVYLVRNLRPSVLLVLGLMVFSVATVITCGFAWLFQNVVDENALRELKQGWNPPALKVQEELNAYRGDWFEQMQQRVPMAILFETFIFGVWAFWRATGLMLIGNALYRLDVLTAARSIRFYATTMIVGFTIGYPLVILGVHQNFKNDWDAVYSEFVGAHYNYWGSLFVAFGYIGALCLLCKLKVLPELLKRAVTAVGQMALTNYLMQSVIGTFIFYGHGLGYIGYVSRTQQLLIVLVVWLFQILFSLLWLRNFKFGPMEWLWRSLIYWRLQPMKKV